jgi:hypothetical protein
MKVSDCCNAEIEVNGGKSVTRYYVCSDCRQAVNPDGKNPNHNELREILKDLACGKQTLLEVTCNINKALSQISKTIVSREAVGKLIEECRFKGIEENGDISKSDILSVKDLKSKLRELK